MTRLVPRGFPAAPSLPLFGLALGLRLACWLWFVASGVRALVDEEAYFRIAGGWADVLRSLARLSLPTGSTLARAWSDAIWPPFHPLLLGLARALPGDDLPVARLAGVIAGAATTVLVVDLSARLAGPRAARAAGLLHALHPSFVFFSATLWSETLFNLLLLALLCVVVRAVDSDAARPTRWSLSLGCGAALLLLTRSAALPMVVGLLAWLAVRLPPGRRLRVVAGATLVLLLLVLPWSVASSRAAGRPIFLSSRDTLNLALGNNPWTPPALGSAWGVNELRGRVLAAASDGKGFGRAGEIARREILEHPLRTAQRVVVRGAQLLALDFFPVRHLATATLPPLAGWTLPAALALQWLSLALLLFLSSVGLCGPHPVKHRTLLVVLAVAGAAGPLATIAMPRLALPLLAVLLPAAGWGWSQLRQGIAPRPQALALLAAGSVCLPVATIRLVVGRYLEPSSHYAPALAPIARALGAAPLYTDVLACRPPQQAEALPRLAEPTPETTRWLETGSLPSSLRRRDSSSRHLALAGPDLERPIALRAGAEGVGITIADRVRWQRFVPLEGTGLSCAWEGAAFPRMD